MKHRKDRVSAIVAPAYVNGTGVIRELARQGAYVVAVDSRAAAPGLHSRHASESVVVPSPGDGPGAFTEFLLSREDLYGGLVVPTDDFFLRELYQHRGELECHYRLCISSGDAVHVALHKDLADAAALAAGIATPKRMALEKKSDLKRAAEVVGFPAGVKPIFSISFNRRFGTKLFRVLNNRELAEAFDKAHEAGEPVILQEIIPGGDPMMLIHVSYWDSSGRCLGDYVCEKTRQHPPLFGVGQFVTVVKNDRVTEIGRRLLKAMNYAGAPASVEYKLDRRDGRLKVIDINTRTGMQIGLSRPAGCDIIDMMWRDKLGLPQIPSGPIRYGMRWLHIKNGILRYRGYPEHRVPWRQLVATFSRLPVFGLLSLDDPKPFLVDMAPMLKRRLL